MIYVSYDENTGRIEGIYDDTKHSYIPKPCLSISQFLREEILKSPGTYSVVNKQVIQNGGQNKRLDEEIQAEYSHLQASNVAKINIEQGITHGTYTYPCTITDQLNVLLAIVSDTETFIWRNNGAWSFDHHTVDELKTLAKLFVEHRVTVGLDLIKQRQEIDQQQADIALHKAGSSNIVLNNKSA